MTERDPRARASETSPGPAPVILTVTPNPSLDLLYTTDSLRWDDANRVDEPRRRPGGQGINVARVATALGARATAVALLGGRTGEEIERTLVDEGTRVRAVRTAAETRLFIAVHVTRSRRSLLINGRGPERSADDAERLLETCVSVIREEKPAWVAGCGSLPPGFPNDFYARLGRAARAVGAKFVADCDGTALRAAAAECDLLVPNRHEAARLLGRDRIGRHSHAVHAARSLLDLGASAVAITVGKRGALLATASGAWTARPPRQTGHSVGAGDAFLAAFLASLARGLPPDAALRSATAAGAAVLRSVGSAILNAGDYDEILASTHSRSPPRSQDTRERR